MPGARRSGTACRRRRASSRRPPGREAAPRRRRASTGSSVGTSPRPATATARRLTTRYRLAQRRADRRQQRPRLDERLLDLGLGLGVPDDPAADPQVDPPLRDREGADRQCEVEVAVRVDAPDRAHRGAATDGLERRDVVDRRDLRRAGHRPAGERRLEQLGQPDVLAQPPLDGRDQVDDPGELLLGHQLRPAHGAVLADPRQVVPLEVDDHHVLGGVLRPTPPGPSAPSGRVPLIGFVQTRRPRRREEELGRGGDDRPAVTGERARLERPERRERSREPGRVAAKRRRQVLDEVDLVDVAGRDRRAHALDGSAVRSLVPGRLPLADAECTGAAARARPRAGSRLRPPAAGTARADRARPCGAAPATARTRDTRRRRGRRPRPRRTLPRGARARRRPASQAPSHSYANVSTVSAVVPLLAALALVPSAAHAPSLSISTRLFAPSAGPMTITARLDAPARLGLRLARASGRTVGWIDAAVDAKPGVRQLGRLPRRPARARRLLPGRAGRQRPGGRPRGIPARRHAGGAHRPPGREQLDSPSPATTPCSRPSPRTTTTCATTRASAST